MSLSDDLKMVEVARVESARAGDLTLVNIAKNPYAQLPPFPKA